MGFLNFQARPLTLLDGTGQWENSDMFDIQDAVAIYAQLKVTAASSSLQVKWQYSIDGQHWEDGELFTSTSTAGIEIKSETTAADIQGRFLRFAYNLTNNETATFSIDVYTRNYS